MILYIILYVHGQFSPCGQGNVCVCVGHKGDVRQCVKHQGNRINARDVTRTVLVIGTAGMVRRTLLRLVTESFALSITSIGLRVSSLPPQIGLGPRVTAALLVNQAVCRWSSLAF